MTRFLSLGASLYVPCTRSDLVPIANRRKYPFLRSVIFCTEDAIRSEDLPRALDNLAALLPQLEPVELKRFVRVRNPTVLRSVLQMDGVERLGGFVLPKVTRHNLEQHLPAFRCSHRFDLMLTLETIEVFDTGEMSALRELLLKPPFRDRILSLRIGGNDLFNLLGMRRPRGLTVYQTPLGSTIGQLVTTFRPHGFNLTAPVFEYLDRDWVLAREVRRDLTQGLFGKTAIHPRQVPLIERQYRVEASELQMAERILEESAPAVFRLHGAMCEPATHRRWAELVRERARLYGVHRKRRLRLSSGPNPAR
jgi:citrate lyase beta subunit